MSIVTENRTTVWAIDPAHSFIEFAVKHMVFATAKGRFSVFSGQVVVPDGNIERTRIEVSIDGDSVDTHDAKRDEHLRSDDFFGVGQHPKITFVSTSVKPDGGDRYKIMGDLTIKGITKPVLLYATFNGRGTNPWGQSVAGFSATGAVDRKEWGLNWNTALEAGGMLVGDEVRISIETELIEQN